LLLSASPSLSCSGLVCCFFAYFRLAPDAFTPLRHSFIEGLAPISSVPRSCREDPLLSCSGLLHSYATPLRDRLIVNRLIRVFLLAVSAGRSRRTACSCLVCCLNSCLDRGPEVVVSSFLFSHSGSGLLHSNLLRCSDLLSSCSSLVSAASGSGHSFTPLLYATGCKRGRRRPRLAPVSSAA
jgi:hypothetical protein